MIEMIQSSEDKKWMARALEEGWKGMGLTAPNPPVGAVLVKEGREVASGWHQKAGLAHAERDALSKVKAGGAAGATLYVTLEPCSTHGRTGACTEALIEAGVSRVVYGMRDPNPGHAGRADAILRDAGIKVDSGILKSSCEELIRGFAMVQREGRPWVIAKTAMSLDGRITRPPGEGQWLSGASAREEVQLLRARVEAILTSGETLRKDDPALTLRSTEISPEKQQPWRVVMTKKELDRERYQIFRDQWRERSLVFENVPKYDVLRTLSVENEVTTVLLEAGGRLLGEFQDEDLIDEWVIYLAPLVTGGASVALGGKGTASLEDRWSLKDVTIRQVGKDLCARGVVDRRGPGALER